MMPHSAPDPAIETAIRAKGEALFALMRAQPVPGLFSRKGVYARLMEWSMRDPGFKTQLFRFVDVLPTLGSGAEVVRYLQEYLGEKAGEIHPSLKIALRMASFAPPLAASVIRMQMSDMARQFVAGANPAGLLKRFRLNAAGGIASTIDLLGEAVVSEREAEGFLARNHEILAALAEEVRKHPEPVFSDLGPDGPVPRINLSVKISALSSAIHPDDPERSIASLEPRMIPLLRHAAEVGAFINFDMESYALKPITLGLFKTLFEREEFRNAPQAGIVIQAYLQDSRDDLVDLIDWARTHQRRIGVRLVKGAYWDYETTLAAQRGWLSPVWSRKAESDACYEELSIMLLENLAYVQPAFASHNVRSVAHAIVRAEAMGVDPRAYEFQALYGMADELKAALRQSGHRVREYCPVGELLPGMAYLVRRLLENTSNEGFLRAHSSGLTNAEELLQSPLLRLPPPAPELPAAQAVPEFRNAANTDFGLRQNREHFEHILKELPATFGKRYPLVIGGKRVEPAEYLPSLNPSAPEQIIGYWARARAGDVDAAIAAARMAQPGWAATPVAERAAALERLADLMEARRFELSALELYEAGKPWSEADADISEAIDFCRFYAAEMRRLGHPHVTQRVAGEHDTLGYLPRGVGVVIAPWNFPLAILCGMTVAPLVAGNAVIMKPAEQTPVIAAHFMQMLEEAGVPPGVANLLTGDGEQIGPLLVEHPAVDFIVFTGSRKVGLQIWETAAKVHPGQANLKKVVCEMGGKNALIIDTSADLDEAIPAALSSAFGFAGQKCSALSRLIVLEEVYGKFVERFCEAAASVPIGDPRLPGMIAGPVIDAEAQEKILGMIERGKREATLAFQGRVPEQGYFVPPTVFTDVPPEASLAQEEIFGPVVAILKAKDLGHAIRIANGTAYALTGGLFSRSPRALERARRELRVGNLYLNRAITGAVVERHPFGGFGMSGGGTKAGGSGYLENFLFPRAIAENVMRRGFTPES